MRALHLGRDADAGVSHPQDGLIAFAAERDRDPAAGLGVLGGVVEQVRHDLLQPGRVAFDPERLGREIDRELVPERLDQGQRRLDGMVDDRAEIDRLLAELDLSPRDPRDVEEDLRAAASCAGSAVRAISSDSSIRRISRDLQANDLEGVRQGRQRVAQLVGQHRQELVLALARLLQLFGLAEKLHLHPLAVGDVGDQAERSLDRAFAITKRIDADMQPAVAQREVSRPRESRDSSILANSESSGGGGSSQSSVGALVPTISVQGRPRMRSSVRLACTTLPEPSSSMTPSLMASNVVCHCRVESWAASSARRARRAPARWRSAPAARRRWSDSRRRRCRDLAPCPRCGRKWWRYEAPGWQPSPGRT